MAVKVIRPDLADKPGFRERFAREVTAARNVNGFYAAQVVDADAPGAVPWLATAYIAGPSLAEAVREQGPLPAVSVLALAAGLAEGLQAIHAAGVVHRDLKPSNVLLAGDGPRVIDFGLARAAEGISLTQSDTFVGTPEFMSPEQADGKPVGPPSDVFSLGATLAFAATGKGPFGTGSLPALMFRVVHREPDIADLPWQVLPLVRRCLAKDPGERPSAADLLAELDAGQFALGWLPSPVTQLLVGYAEPLAPAPHQHRPGDQATATGRGSRLRHASAAITQAPEATGRAPGITLRRLMSRPAVAWTIVASVVVAALAIGLSILPGSSSTVAPVPNVLHRTLSAAASALKSGGFRNIPYQYGCYRSRYFGDVIRQVPGAGTRIGKTRPVLLYLQANDCNIVPGVIGMNLQNAAYTLKKSGFSNIPWVNECLGSQSVGAVIRQAPAGGTSYLDSRPVSLKLQANNC